MSVSRRALLNGGLLAVAGTLAACDERQRQPQKVEINEEAWDTWASVRDLFPLSADKVHMSAMLISSHPTPVQNAIDEYRRTLNADPAGFLEENNERLTNSVRAAAGAYFGVDARDVALTDSATMGIGLVYNALRLRSGQELLTTDQDYFVTHEALRLAAERSGARLRTVSLYQDVKSVTSSEMLERLRAGLTPATRVLALTWVHSSTGLKIPAGEIAKLVSELNARRDKEDRILFCLDGTHGVGNQVPRFADLGCDFLMSGGHKWLFGPRGTGFVIAKPDAWQDCHPIIPSFIDGQVLDGWIAREAPPGPTTAARMTPGGFKSFEHVWALAEAFALHQKIGPERIKDRTDGLADRLKTNLAEVKAVRLQTPPGSDLAAGIVSFDVDGMSPHAAVQALRRHQVIASVAPYATPHVRLTPSLQNNEGDVDTAVDALRRL